MSSKKRRHNSKPYNNISPQERYVQIINQAKQLVRDLLQEALDEEFRDFPDSCVKSELDMIKSSNIVHKTLLFFFKYIRRKNHLLCFTSKKNKSPVSLWIQGNFKEYY